MKAIAVIVLVLIVMLLGFWGYNWSRSEWINAGYVGVLYSSTNGLEEKVYDPQRIFIPWRHQLLVYPTMVRAAIYTEDPNQGEVKAADGILMTTSDNANTKFDLAIFYKVKKEDIFLAFKSFGANSMDEIQTTNIRSAAREASNDVSTGYSVFALMGPKREEVSDKITAKLREKLEPKGITIVNVLICTTYPDQGTSDKINERVNALTDLSIAEIKSEIASVQRSTATITDTAKSRADKLKASQTGTRSLELLKLEADKAAIEKWNGRLPMVPSKSTMILPAELFSMAQPQAQANEQEQPEQTEQDQSQQDQSQEGNGQ